MRLARNASMDSGIKSRTETCLCAQVQRRVIYAFGLDTINSTIIIIFNPSSHRSYKCSKYDHVSLTPYFPPALFSIKLI